MQGHHQSCMVHQKQCCTRATRQQWKTEQGPTPPCSMSAASMRHSYHAFWTMLFISSLCSMRPCQDAAARQCGNLLCFGRAQATASIVPFIQEVRCWGRMIMLLASWWCHINAGLDSCRAIPASTGGRSSQCHAHRPFTVLH